MVDEAIDGSRRLKEIWARALAGAELMLELIQQFSFDPELDADEIAITCAIIVAEMHAELADAAASLSQDAVVAPATPRKISTSRLRIAAATGLARETVRRKVKRLIECGILEATGASGVRTARRFVHGWRRKIGDRTFAAATQYDLRLRSLGAMGVGRR